MKLKSIYDIKGKLILLSGTSIGGDSGTIEIGGNDNPIIRNPITKEPYIPGSSIKGKMRSSLEWLEGKISSDGSVHNCEEKHCPICRIFGRSANISEKAKVGPTRLIVKDAYLTEDSKLIRKEIIYKKGFDSEMKCENSINRITSEAMPRNNERIPAGMEFEFSMVYKVYDINDDGKVDDDNFNVVLKGLKLLEIEGIGGGTSRGNGSIKLEVFKNGEFIDLENLNI